MELTCAASVTSEYNFTQWYCVRRRLHLHMSTKLQSFEEFRWGQTILGARYRHLSREYSSDMFLSTKYSTIGQVSPTSTRNYQSLSAYSSHSEPRRL
jgi:hypothetical protein